METILFSIFFAALIGGLIIYSINKSNQQKKQMEELYRERTARRKLIIEKFGGLSTENLQERADEFLKSTDLQFSEKSQLLNNLVISELEVMLDDHHLSADEEKRLEAFMSHFSSDLWDEGLMDKIFKAKLMRALMEGEELPEPDGDTSIILGRNERLIYVFDDVTFAQERSKTSFVGGSAGISFRVAKGVYLRTGAFKGQPVVTSQIVTIDTGELVITDQNIYFRGDKKSFKIEFKKLINIEAYSDGIKIEKEGASFKPFFFMGIDVWFCGNLVNHLASDAR